MLFQVVALLLVTRASIVQSFCTNSWAVEVHGGREVAKRVVLKHGFAVVDDGKRNPTPIIIYITSVKTFLLKC